MMKESKVQGQGQMQRQVSESTVSPRVEKILKIRGLLQSRDEARLAGNYVQADSLREALLRSFPEVEVIDQKNGPSGWRFKDGSSNKIPPGTVLPGKEKEKDNIPNTGKKRKRSSGPDEQEQEQDSTKRLKQTSPPQSTSTSISANKPLKTASAATPAKNTPKTPLKAVVPSSSKKVTKPSLEQERLQAMASRVLGSSAPAKSSSSSTSSSSQSRRVVHGVVIEDTQPATSSTRATRGDRLKVNYVGRLQSNNKIFDSSVRKPFTFRLGAGEVIAGWDIGFEGMCVGASRRLTIPPEKAYGKHGAPPTIPPNSTLVFDVTLLSVA